MRNYLIENRMNCRFYNGLGRVTLIVGLPPRLTSFSINSSQISPFSPSLAGRLEQLMSPLASVEKLEVAHSDEMKIPNF